MTIEEQMSAQMARQYAEEQTIKELSLNDNDDDEDFYDEEY